MDNKQWMVYLIRCSDESLYCGITNNLKNRLVAHNLGKGAKYTRSRKPVELVGASSKMTKSDALKLEYQVKQVPAGKKIFELIKGEDKMAMNLKAVIRELNTIAKKIDRLVIALDKIEKPKAKTAKAKPKKKVAFKKPAAKKTTKLTAVDNVFGAIKRYKKGVDC